MLKRKDIEFSTKKTTTDEEQLFLVGKVRLTSTTMLTENFMGRSETIPYSEAEKRIVNDIYDRLYGDLYEFIQKLVCCAKMGDGYILQLDNEVREVMERMSGGLT